MERRNLFDKLFGFFRKPTNYQRWEGLSGYSADFVPFGTNAYASDVVRATIHSIASNAAKLKAKHVRRLNGKVECVGGNLERLLTVRPNEYMNAYDFFYRVVTNLMLQNNAFIYVMRENDVITGFYPINTSAIELLEAPGNVMLVKFRFGGGSNVVLPYEEILHLRRHYNQNEMYGESNNPALLPALELVNTTNQGIINAVKTSGKLRGLLRFSQSMLKPEDIKKQRDDFISDYMSVSNSGGIAAIDAKAEYTPLNNTPILIDGNQMQLIEDKIYKYFNVNKNIVTSSYKEEEWNAFYEGVLEPLAIQMSLEFSSKLFTNRAIGHGNEIIFEANRLQYASVGSKIKIINTLTDRGLLSLNEAREIFNLSPIENGDKRIISLNYVDADKANQYQLGEKPKKGDDEDEKGDQDSGAESD